MMCIFLKRDFSKVKICLHPHPPERIPMKGILPKVIGVSECLLSAFSGLRCNKESKSPEIGFTGFFPE